MSRLATPVPRRRRLRAPAAPVPLSPTHATFEPYGYHGVGETPGPVQTVAEKLAPGPAATKAAAHTPPPSKSGGTSGDLSIPGYQPETPTSTPYVPSEPAHSTQDFARAFAAKRRRELLGTLAPLPAPGSALGTTPIDRLAQAAGGALADPLQTLLGALPKPSASTQLLDQVAPVKTQLPTIPHYDISAELKASQQVPSAPPPPKYTPAFAKALQKTQGWATGTKAQKEVRAAVDVYMEEHQDWLKDPNQPRVAKALAIGNMQAPVTSVPAVAAILERERGGHGAGAGVDLSNRADPLGAKTLGNASVAQLAAAAAAGKLKVNGQGILTTPRTRAALAGLLAARKAVQASSALGKVPNHGTLTPEQIGTLLVEEGRKIHAHLTPAEVAEGIGVAEAESAGNADEQRQLADFSDPEKAHIGLFAEEGGSDFGNVEERLAARSAAHGAIERFLADDRSWNPAWVHWQEIQGEEETGADRAPQYRSLAEELVHASGHADPKAAESLEQAKALAREAGIDPSTVLNKHTILGPVDPQEVTRFHAALKAAKALAGGHIPYVWGGGHGGFEESPGGLDCSGAVSWVLHKMGVLDEPLTSGNMGEVLEPGPGAVTVYYNAGHTFMKIGKHFFGTSVDDSSKGLAFYGQPPAEYLNTFSVGHVPGLGKKVALQLGIKPSELGGGAGGDTEGEVSSGGITYSEGGTTATIEQGKGKKQTTPGYSNQPVLPEFTVPAAPDFAASVAVPEITDEQTAAQELLALLTRPAMAVNRA